MGAEAKESLRRQLAATVISLDWFLPVTYRSLLGIRGEAKESLRRQLKVSGQLSSESSSSEDDGAEEEEEPNAAGLRFFKRALHNL